MKMIKTGKLVMDQSAGMAPDNKNLLPPAALHAILNMAIPLKPTLHSTKSPSKQTK